MILHGLRPRKCWLGQHGLRRHDRIVFRLDDEWWYVR